MTNPLVEQHALPPFHSIEAEHVVPAVEMLLDEGRKLLASMESEAQATTWESIVEPLEAQEERLTNAWSPVSHLFGVKNTPQLREQYEIAQQQLTEYYSELGQNKHVFEAYQTIKDSDEFAGFNQPKKQTIENALRNFKLSGVDLEGEKAERYKAIQSRLSSLSNQFSNNVLDATQGWSKHVLAEADLAGLPDFIVAGAKTAAEAKSLDGYVLTLDLPVYITVQTQSDNRALREEMYQAYSTRASQEGPTAGQWDNTPLIEEILELRKELAELLGFDHYADLSLARKMAESTTQVIGFLEDLAAKSKPFAEREVTELKDFARQEHHLETLEPWDLAYYSEKLKLAKYNVSQEMLREYFPVDTVIAGLFKVAGDLFDIQVVERNAVETWHDDVRFYEIYRGDEVIAGFYLDLFARPEKRGGAWMAGCRDRRVSSQGLQIPVAFLVCNFNGPTADKPALLTHNDVTTLFHEFGHGLHHMLTQIDIAAVSGISGVAWDAVELPSQFMENFCWEPEVLAFLSKHYQTGESLPAEVLANMLAAKNFQSAMQMLRQVEFALFDIRLHKEFGSIDFKGVQALLDEVRDEVAVLVPPSYNRFQNGFSHIFAGGYAAGYYSYKWAEVLSADAFSAFEEEGVFNPETGQRFLTEILEKGGAQDAAVLFRNFRGRDPKIDALLRHGGLV